MARCSPPFHFLPRQQSPLFLQKALQPGKMSLFCAVEGKRQEGVSNWCGLEQEVEGATKKVLTRPEAGLLFFENQDPLRIKW